MPILRPGPSSPQRRMVLIESQFIDRPSMRDSRSRSRFDRLVAVKEISSAEKPQPMAWRERPAKVAGESRSDAPAARQEAGASADGRLGAATGAARDEAAPMPAAPLAKLGTGHGRNESAPTQMVRFERASPTPAETIALHYDRRENLVAMGILPSPVVAHAPNPFPAWTPRFVPNPPPR